MDEAMGDFVLEISAVARRWNVSRSYVQRLVALGKIPARNISLGKVPRWRLSRQGAERFFEGVEEEGHGTGTDTA